MKTFIKIWLILLIAISSGLAFGYIYYTPDPYHPVYFVPGSYSSHYYPVYYSVDKYEGTYYVRQPYFPKDFPRMQEYPRIDFADRIYPVAWVPSHTVRNYYRGWTPGYWRWAPHYSHPGRLWIPSYGEGRSRVQGHWIIVE